MENTSHILIPTTGRVARAGSPLNPPPPPGSWLSAATLLIGFEVFPSRGAQDSASSTRWRSLVLHHGVRSSESDGVPTPPQREHHPTGSSAFPAGRSIAPGRGVSQDTLLCPLSLPHVPSDNVFALRSRRCSRSRPTSRPLRVRLPRWKARLPGQPSRSFLVFPWSCERHGIGHVSSVMPVDA